MVFVEQLRVRRKRRLEEGMQVFVGVARGCEIMPFQDAPCVSVDDKCGVIAGVEEDRVRGFAADAVDGEELAAEVGSRGSKHSGQGAAIVLKKKVSEGF